VTDRLEIPTARVVTMRELNQRTAAVLEEINQSGRPALVSKHGQYIAMITPLAKHSIESVVFANDPELRDLLDSELKHAAENRDSDLTVAEARARLRSRSSDSPP
jgi:antitoxin (DNA-binding transcriptional repressor) of toxin-antitoxin stability system